jgi:nicotinate-nucleotide adenylyltransferase
MVYHPPAPHLLSSRRWAGMRIGLLGGSFNPPHEGHMHIALAALRKHNLDYIWWMVSPQNPLKDKATGFNKRYFMTKYFVNHPKMIVTDIETKLGIDYSFQTVQQLQKRFPRTDFVWIAGMDNAQIFHKWDRWKDLISRIPFIFFNRPPNAMALNNNAVRMMQRQKNIQWSLQGKTRNISSTQLRQNAFARRLKSALYWKNK